MFPVWLLLFFNFNFLETLSAQNNACSSSKILTEENYTHVQCHGNNSLMENLKDILSNITEPIRIFELRDTALDALPADIFERVENAPVQKVIFDNVSLELLTVPTLGAAPFESVQETVEQFTIYDSSHLFAWNFSSLSHLKNMKNLVVENSDLIAVYLPFEHWPELRFVQLINSSLKWIHPRLFHENHKLAICSLSSNDIRHVERSMFPKPASCLWSLDLSSNKLGYLPEDLFTDMIVLVELKLDNNLLKIISKSVFYPVWNNLTQLWLDGNPTRCESAKWTNRTRDLPLFMESSKCYLKNELVFFDTFLKGYEDNTLFTLHP